MGSCSMRSESSKRGPLEVLEEEVGEFDDEEVLAEDASSTNSDEDVDDPLEILECPRDDADADDVVS